MAMLDMHCEALLYGLWLWLYAACIKIEIVNRGMCAPVLGAVPEMSHYAGVSIFYF